MEEVRFGRWTITHDRHKTREAHAALSSGAPEECGCDPCINFIAARNQLYPAQALQLLDQLGVPSFHEAEVYHLAKLASGLHLYGGWFHFVGTISAGADAARKIRENLWQPDLEPLGERFALGFTSKIALARPPFIGLPLVQLEFHAEIPWIVSKPEPG